jgi:hypothetical protein
MPSRIAFLYSNLFSASATTLVASSAVSALPVGAAANEDRSYVWRSVTDTVVQTIDIDLGSVLPVSAVAVANVRLLGTGVLELYQRGDAGSAGAAVLVTTLSSQNTYTRTAFAFFSSQSHRHWQLKWTNPTAASGYAELGFAFLGVEVEPAVNIMVPADIERIDPSVGAGSVDGQMTFSRRTKYCAGTWAFHEVGETQLGQLQALFEAIGVAGAHFVVLDTNLAWSCWYARLAGELSAPLAIVAGRYSPSIAWREVC